MNQQMLGRRNDRMDRPDKDGRNAYLVYDASKYGHLDSYSAK